jgi:hypothetical protein
MVFFTHGFFYPEDGGNTFLLNFGSQKTYAGPHPRRWQSCKLFTFINLCLCILTSKRHKRPWTYSLQKSASEHSSTCHCIHLLHNLLNVLVQIANKMGLQKKLQQESVQFFDTQAPNVILSLLPWKPLCCWHRDANRRENQQCYSFIIRNLFSVVVVVGREAPIFSSIQVNRRENQQCCSATVETSVLCSTRSELANPYFIESNWFVSC